MESITQQGKRLRYPALSNRERDLEIRNRRLEEYVSRLLAERVRLIICPVCLAEREEVR